jgi:hypothetical protein
MTLLSRVPAIYWVVFGGMMALVAINDGPIVTVGIIGGVLGLVLAIIAGMRRRDGGSHDSRP